MYERDETPGHEGSASRPAERRTYARLASNLAASCRPTGRSLEPGWLGTVRDISPGGVGLILQHRFQRGTFLDIELRDAADVLLRTIRVRVIHATALHLNGRHVWLLGCAFEQPLSDE